MTIWDFLVATIVPSVLSFFLGLIFKKSVARGAIRAKKWLVNDVMTVGLTATRVYPDTDVRPLTTSVYDRARNDIPSLKLNDVFAEEMIVTVPTFNKVTLTVERITPATKEDDRASLGPEVRVVVKPETPIRLGAREFDKLNDFSSYSNALFSAVEIVSLVGSPAPKSAYATCNLKRTARFIEQNTLDIEDEELGCRVSGTQTQLQIVVSPISQMTKAALKYRFA
jgi:hypothetical protein